MKACGKYLFLTILILCFSTKGFGRAVEREDASDAYVPDNVMEHVVRKILRQSFAPQSKPKEIYLAARVIKRSWLPEIKNIEFQLLSDKEIEKHGDVYFFRKPELSDGKYKIKFGFGDPDCRATGDTWTFILSNKDINLRYTGGWGSGCSSSIGFGFAEENVQAKENRPQMNADLAD